MIDFIDKTDTQNGTPINRENMMAIQGFQSKTTTFNDDGSITETNELGQQKTTTFNDDGSITEVFVGEKASVMKTTVFNQDGSITENSREVIYE